MLKSQANRAIIASRTQPQPRIPARPAVDLTARLTTVVEPYSPGTRRSRRPGSDKGQNEWRTVSALNRKWH